MKSRPPHPPLVAGIKAAVRSFSGLLFAALLVTGGNLSAAPDLKATQTGAFPPHADSRAREGETITYSTVISNATGTNAATGVQFTNPTPANTTDIVGSVTISPLAFPDTYSAGKNIQRNVVAPGVLTNDTGLPAPSAVPIAAGATAQGGTVILNADGSFSYTPANNFTGPDTFTYTVTNANSPDDSTTVTITVVAPPIAVDDGYNVITNTPLSVVAPGVLGNDTTNTATIASYGINGTEQTTIGAATPTAQSGGSVSLNADGSFTYTPPTNYSGSDTFKYTLSNIGGNSVATVTFTVTNCSPITVTNPGVTSGTVDAAFNQTFTQSGGAGTVTFTLASGSLPAGLSLATNGTLSGTPTQKGSFPITVKATDSNGCTGTGSTYTLVINCQTISVTNPVTNTGTVGAPFSQTFTQTGAHGTATFTTASTLPAGLSLATSGTLSGTPTQNGSFPIVVTVTDSNGCTGAGSTYTLTISCQTITVTNPATSTGTVNAVFSQIFTQTGAVGGATFTLNTGTLPTGLSLATNGTLSGTPTQTGSFPMTVKVTDGNGCTGVGPTYTLVISCQTITVTNPATSSGTVDAPFSDTFTQTGAAGTATFTINSGTLPNGMSLATNGTLSGTPTQAGSFPITVKVTDGNGCTGISPTYTLVIACQTITVTNPTSSTGTVDAALTPAGNYTFTQSGVGTHTPAVFTINTGTLPSGVTLSAAGVLSGTPGQPGSFPITVKVTDANGCTGISSTYTLVIACQTITVTNPATSNGTVDSAFSQTFTQTGVGTHTPAVFTLNSGSLPSGLSLSAAGVLSGTPGVPGSFPITVKVTDANGCTGVGPTYTLVIACQVITVTNPGTTVATYNTAFSQTFTQSGVGTHTPATFTLNSGTLPTGLSLSTAGVLSGTPTQTGNFPITVKVTDANGCTGISPSFALSVPPKLVAETYSDVGNTQLRGGVVAPATPSVDGSTGVGANDTSDTTITYALFSGPSQGAVSLNSDGTFLYTPAAGNNTTATFVYSGTSNGATATQTATINFTNRVWYVNSSGANGDGRSNTPFNSMTGADTASGANDYVFVHTGGATTPGTITLAAGQTLWGQGATFTVGPLTIASGAKPTLTGTVTLGGNNDTVSSLDLSTGTSTGLTNSGTITGALVQNNVTVTTTTGTGVSFSNIAGTLTFTGLTTNGGTGASLTGSNGSATFSFSNVVVSSGASAAFTATGGGTVNVTGATNTLTTTTGTALNVANTTIGASGLTFLSINAPTASGNPGIILNNTGSVGLTVTGTGTTAGSGGTISNKTGNGVDLRTASNVTLKNMNLTNNAQTNGQANPVLCGVTGSSGDNASCTADAYLSSVSTITFDNVNINGSNQNGINGLNVSNLKIQNGSTVQNCGNESGENGVFIQNLSGLSCALTNSTFSNNNVEQFAFINFAAGTLGNAGSPFNVSGCTFTGKGNTVVPGGDGILGRIASSGSANINIGGGANTASHFKKNFSYGVFLDAINSASLTFTVNGCDFGTGGAANYNNSGIATGISGTATVNYTISNNTVIGVAVGTPSNGTGIVVTSGTTSSGASIIGSITGNTIGDAAISGSGGFDNAAAMQLLANGGGDMVFKSTVTGNHIHNPTALGIQYIGGTITGAVTGTLHITGNDISTDDSVNGFQPGAVSGIPVGQAIAVAAAASGSGGSVSTLCADIGGAGANANTITGTWDGANGDAIRVTTLRGSVYTVGNMPGSGTATVAEVTAFVSGQNGGAVTSGSNTASGGGTFVKNNGSACPLLLSAGGTFAGQPVLTDISRSSLGQRELDSVIVAAIARWSATGLTPAQVATLRELKFEIADLPGAYLGEANGNRIRVSRNASGRGWSINSYSEVAPAGRVDLLTAIMHEMGHALGLPDTYDAKDRDKVMYGYLTTGERRVPAANDAAGAKPLTLDGPHYLSPGETPVTVGTIPAGKSVTVRFKVTIGNPIPSNASPISSQGTVKGSNFSDVLTDDPAFGGATDPTLTPVTIPPRAFSAGGPPPATGTVNQVYAGYTFVADGAPAPTYTVQSGTLPPGITLDANTGALAGTPTQVGVYSGIVVRATNAAGVLDTSPFTITINQVAATLSTQASASVSLGNAIFDTATINGTSPTGTVTFKLFGPGNSTCTGTAISTTSKPVSGNGNYQSANFIPTAAGTYNWIATYSGDANNAGATGTCGAANESVVVTKGATTMAVITSKTPTVFGESVTFTATVSPTSPATTTPTGTVQFLVDNVNFGGPVTLNGSGLAQLTTSSLSVGPHTIKADYQGDTNYAGSNGSTAQTVNQDSTSTTVSSSVNPSKFGQSVTFTATVTANPPGGGTPTGLVQFTVDGTNLGSAVALSGGTAQASTASITVTGSPHLITATYNGDSNFLGSSGSVAGGQTVNQANTTTSVSSSANPSAPGQNVTFTATVVVVPPGAGTPTGTVQFKVDGNNLGGAVALSGGGTAQASTSTITVAGSPHTVTATYSGDSNFAGSNGSLPGGQTVGKLSPTMTTQASPGVNTGGNITDTATLSGGTSLTGTIVFKLYGPNDGTCAGAAVFTSTKTVSGTGPYTSDPFTATAAGIYRWVATYSGDVNNNGVNGACNDANESVTVSKVSPTISTQASAGINVGGNISDTATLAGGVSPSGTITFTLFGPNNNTCSGAAIFTSTVNVNGNGNYTSANFAPSTFGTYNWIATYSGDANNNTVAGACGAPNESVFVDQPPVLQWSASTYSVNENGGSVTLTITRTGNTSQSAIVHYSTANGSATAGQDYTASSGDVNFGVGETSKPVVITILDDNASEGNETFTATLSAVAGAAVGNPQTTTVTIVDNEPAPTPTPTPTATPTATPTPTPTATPTPTPNPTPTPAQALNLSTRMRVDIGDKAVITGFIITGNASKDVVIRGLGPSLVNSNVPAATVLNDPYLELHGPNGSLITFNDNWVDSPQRSQFENTVFKPTDNRESVILAKLPPGNYTAILTGVGQTTGIGLVEVYDNNQAVDSVLANISARGYVKKDDEVMIGGFTLGGNPNNTRIAVRGLGPSLASSNLANLLADPTLALHNANGTIMISNDDWTDDPISAGQLSANGLAPQNPKESGIFATLPPGPFTVILAGKNGGFGIGLVEIYNLR